jgi:glycosyltransferase involved in cell wall biosynthesis
MRILSLHNRYLIRGGEDESREAEERLLREMGHEVNTYEEDNKALSTLSSIEAFSRTLWSQPTYRAVYDRLTQNRHDIVHIQNFFPLISPSAHYAARATGVPVIQTLRNYRLICPNGLFFRAGKVCEDCMGLAIPYPGVVHRCYRDNFVASSGVAAMVSVHRLLQTWQHQVTLFIALTNFARSKFIQAGFPADKIVVKPNFVAPDPGVGSGTGGYGLYVGRLSVEKGLDTLLEAWNHVSGLPLKIIGEGPLADQVQTAVQRSGTVEWLGRRPLSEVYRLMGEATVVLFPSNWYETFGRVAVEAFATGTPVIGAKIGAIAEIIDHGRTGLHFNPGDPLDLAAQIDWLLSHPIQIQSMRQAARAEFEQRYTASINYTQLLDIYQRATDLNRR